MRNQKFLWRNSQRVRNFNKFCASLGESKFSRLLASSRYSKIKYSRHKPSISMGKRAAGARVYHFNWKISFYGVHSVYWEFGMSCYHQKFNIFGQTKATLER
jgi:hypothetical protein